jgi:septal ring factor EnvC (AmiA/AmiB activator)
MARREIAVTVALEQMKRDRLNASTRSMSSISARGASPVSLPHIQQKCSSIGFGERTSPSVAEIAALSKSVDELRSQLERSEARVEKTRSELEEAVFRTEEAERRRVAALSRLERASRSAGLADGAEATAVPPTRAGLRSPSADETGAEPRFRLPLRGAIAQRFGERRGGQRSQGLLLSADRPQPVLAPGTGVVAYAGPFRDLGLLLIIEHRNAYHSLVIGASRLEVQAGDVVTEGQAVGWLDRDPSGSMDLYLELRRVGEPVDPMPVLSAHEGEVEG